MDPRSQLQCVIHFHLQSELYKGNNCQVDTEYDCRTDLRDLNSKESLD